MKDYFSWQSDLHQREKLISRADVGVKPVFMPVKVGMPSEVSFKNPPGGGQIRRGRGAVPFHPTGPLLALN